MSCPLTWTAVGYAVRLSANQCSRWSRRLGVIQATRKQDVALAGGLRHMRLAKTHKQGPLASLTPPKGVIDFDRGADKSAVGPAGSLGWRLS